MYSFVNTPLGWFHLIAALLGMLSGAFVLFKPKGTKLHKNIGYVYLASIISVCGSALLIYNLTGYFGIFHLLALVALATLVAGMIPLLIKNKSYRVFHLWFMYYSVVGLYAAFASELSVRIPERPFYTLVGIATGMIFVAGSIFIVKKEKVWSRYFAS
jgi:uncharacterized membrane protein